MAQHFLLSAKARTLSISRVMRMTDDEAFETFKLVRWTETEGQPVCPRCACEAIYTFKARRIFKCKGCSSQFSVTTGTIFASRKLPLRDLLAAIAIFVNGAKGYSALQLSRDLYVQYKTAFVMAHKLREALGQQVHKEVISGDMEVDGAYFGGYIKPANEKEHRLDRRHRFVQNGKRKCVVVMREREGTTKPLVFQTEAAGVPAVVANVCKGSTIHADEARHWDALEGRYETKRINHSEAYSKDGACTNMAESFFSRLRRAEVGTHHHISGKYLSAYANEMAWREDNRRVSNGGQYLMVASASMEAAPSNVWRGYWQR